MPGDATIRGMRLNLSADEVLATTRSVRKRLDFDRPVEREIIMECLELALQAPTGSNSQGWQWVFVEDQDKKDALAEIYRTSFEAYRKMPRASYGADDTRAERMDAVVDSAGFLSDNFEKSPIMMIPCIQGRVDASGPSPSGAGMWGSILPAVWSMMLALRERAHRIGVDDAPSGRRRRASGRRAPGHPVRDAHPGRPVPDRLHQGHRFQARQAPPGRPGDPLGSLVSASVEDDAQHGFAYRFGWGLDGLASLAPHSDVIVVVDVLRFTTAVSTAIDAGAVVFPCRWQDARAPELAVAHQAVLAGDREDGGPSLSPTDLIDLAPGTRIVLPSPNGSTLALAAAESGVPFVLAGALRNATATARRARALAHDGAVGVIAAGERREPGSWRAALEDLLGAGAVLSALDPSRAVSEPRCSPDAAAARAAFLDAKQTLGSALSDTASGRELIARGWDDDVRTAAELDVSSRAAQLVDGAFVAV